MLKELEHYLQPDARDPITTAAESEGEGGAGESGRQSFPQKFSSRLQNATTISDLALSSCLGRGSELRSATIGQRLLHDPAPRWKPAMSLH